MPLDAQYSLSVELTKFVPLALTTVVKSYEAAMKLARDLQSSGSDIVVEEDLGGVLGRSSVTDNIASSFRTAISTPDAPQPLANGISLMRGPGPTVTRALTEKPYFSTVVQCSFLVYVHEKASLAAAINSYFVEAIGEGPGHLPSRTAPSTENIKGMLCAIEDQTSYYGWRKQLLAVAAALEVDEVVIHQPIPRVILHGLMSMLPIVQHFPEDRSIVIGTILGVCSIVEWVHVILGLPILIKFLNGDISREVHLPTGDLTTKRIIVNVHTPPSEVFDEPYITLLSTSTREQLFKLKAAPDDDLINFTSKRPLKGFCSKMFERSMRQSFGKLKILDEMRYFTYSFAFRMAKNLCRDTFNWPIPQSGRGPADHQVHIHIHSSKMVDAFRLLFDRDEGDYSHNLVKDYEAKYDRHGFSYLREHPPKSLLSKLEEWEDGHLWEDLLENLILACLLILTFSHVTDLDSCTDFPIVPWDGEKPIRLLYTDWMQCISLMLHGHNEYTAGFSSNKFDFRETCLLSAKGWSFYVNTLGNIDPSYIDPGFITIRRGVPWREGVWKHSVIDGLTSGTSHAIWKKDRVSGDTAHLRCVEPIRFDKPMIGEHGDSFVVTLRLVHPPSSTATVVDRRHIRRTGYHELWRAHSMAVTTNVCNHLQARDEDIVLEPGWATLSGLGEYLPDDFSQWDWGRTLICLTAGNSAARWRTMLSITRLGMQRPDQRLMLRGPGCCLKCAILQAAQQAGKWYVVL